MHGEAADVAAKAAHGGHDLSHSVHACWSWLVQLITRPAGLYGLEWLVVSMTICCVLGYLAYRASRRVSVHPTGVQNFLEMLYEWVEGLVLSMAGPAGRPYIPLVGTVFVFIAAANLIGLIPGLVSPTSNLNCTAAMAGLVIVLVHVIAVGELGFKNYFLHLCGEPLWLAPLMFPMHAVSEYLAKPLSLAVRLFGNIYGEDQVIVNLTILGISVYHATYLPVPVQLPLLAFGIFTSFVQALVFAMLTTTYIALFISEHHSHDPAHHDMDGLDHEHPAAEAHASGAPAAP